MYVWYSEIVKEPVGIIDHDVFEARCCLSESLGLSNLASCDRRFILDDRLFFDSSPSFNLGLLESWRDAVEYVDETDSTLSKIGGSVEKAA